MSDLAVHALDIESGDAARHDVLSGDEIRFSLPDLYSAGYRWDVSGAGAALDVARLPDGPDADPEAVGSGPPILYAVRGKALGVHRLAFELRRPWEDRPARVVEVSLRVHRPTVLDGLRRA